MSESPLSRGSFDDDEVLQILDQDLPTRFTQRATDIPGDYRIAWRVSVLCLLLSHGRSSSLRLEHLHVLWWAAGSSASRARFLRWWNGYRSPEEVIVRFDPALTTSVDLALGQGLVLKTRQGALELSEDGLRLVRQIREDPDLLLDERAFLNELPRKIPQNRLQQILEWT